MFLCSPIQNFEFSVLDFTKKASQTSTLAPPLPLVSMKILNYSLPRCHFPLLLVQSSIKKEEELIYHLLSPSHITAPFCPFRDRNSRKQIVHLLTAFKKM